MLGPRHAPGPLAPVIYLLSPLPLTGWRCACRDTLIYSVACPRLNRRVAVKVYNRAKVQATKYRAIKREIAMMLLFMRQK